MSRPINIARACDVLGKPKHVVMQHAGSTGKTIYLKEEGKQPADGMNKTEARFKREMLDELSAVWFVSYESIKLRLADRTWYTPDFFVWTDDGVHVYEVKGSWKAPHQEDSRVKLKVAAELYPQFTFYSAVPNRETGGWHIEEIPCRQRQ